MTEDNMFKKSVIASVVASVIVIIFINPILSAAWKLISWFGMNCYSGLNNSIYTNAALGQRDWVIVLILNMALGIMFGLMTGRAIATLSRKSRENRAGEITSTSKKIMKQILHITVYIIAVLSGLFILTLTRADLQLNTSFQQRLTVLAPITTDLELKQLRASWAMMQSRKDYETIVTKIEAIATSHGVVLPAPLIK